MADVEQKVLPVEDAPVKETDVEQMVSTLRHIERLLEMLLVCANRQILRSEPNLIDVECEAIMETLTCPDEVPDERPSPGYPRYAGADCRRDAEPRTG